MWVDGFWLYVTSVLSGLAQACRPGNLLIEYKEENENLKFFPVNCEKIVRRLLLCYATF